MADKALQDDREKMANPARPTSPLGHRTMFFLLTCVAFAMFAPVILIPITQSYCDLLAEEDRLDAGVAELRREAERRADLTEAFANDASINERLALLDLRYTKPDEIVLPVLRRANIAALPRPAETRNPAELTLPEEWPGWARAAEHWASRQGLVGIFLDSSLRPIILLMAAGLAIAAFCLFAPKAPDRESRSPRPVASRAG